MSNASEPKHILIVEDEKHLAVGIQYNLEAEGYRVSTAADGPAALRILSEPGGRIDLVVLDIMLPGMSGYAVCDAIRESGNDTPVLILSARTLPEDRTRSFDVGANQYMTKPFELQELLSRVKNLLATLPRSGDGNSSQPVTATLLTFGNAEVNFRTHEVSVDDKSVRLTQRELELLRYFAIHEGRVISRQELLENVWQMPGTMNTRAVDQFIHRLRKIFEPDAAKPIHFLTLRDAGYRFVAKPSEES